MVSTLADQTQSERLGGLGARLHLLSAVALGAWLAGATAVADTPMPSARIISEQTLYTGDGITVEEHRWVHGMRRGRLWLVSLPVDAAVRVIPAPEPARLTDLIPPDAGPMAAINGGFYDTRGRPLGAVISRGRVHNQGRAGGGSGVLIVSDTGPGIVPYPRFADQADQVREALQSIDRIIADGHSVVRVGAPGGYGVRSAVAIAGDRLLFAVAAADWGIREVAQGIDLRWPALMGLPLWAFAELLVEASGAEAALNLDGGDSTQLIVRGRGFEFHINSGGRTINGILVSPAAGHAR